MHGSPRRGARRLLTAAVLTAAMAAGSGAIALATVGDSSLEPSNLLQRALDKLDQGQYKQAGELARRSAQQNFPMAQRGHLVTAVALHRDGKHAQAIEAYKQFMAHCPDAPLRQYAQDQIAQCEAAINKPAPLVAPSKNLTDAQLAELAAVENEVRVESSDHFIVRARNAKLAKLVAVEAETALRRICGAYLSSAEYANTVDVYVWTDRKDYTAHAVDAPDWSGGNYSLSVKGGNVIRRIDLMQLDEAGKFQTITLDRILPHELCHLVMREFFGESPCPLFLNEGLAMLAESQVDNQRLALAGTALAGKGKIDLADLLVQNRVAQSSSTAQPHGDVSLFYAESYSLLTYLRQRMTDAQLKDLLEHIKDGCTFEDALNRSLCRVNDDSLLPSLSYAWEEHAIEQAQYLRAVKGDRDAFSSK